MPYNAPAAYLITFRTYGTWLHGDDRGSVDRAGNNIYGQPLIPPDRDLHDRDEQALQHAAVTLSDAQREVVDRTMREVCEFKRWRVLALNVRTNHVHLVVVAANTEPEPVLTTLKAWCTRRLREAGLVGEAAHVWSRHGSTKWLFSATNVESAVQYVRDMQ